MFRKITDHKRTAVIGNDGMVRKFYDDGWDNMADGRPYKATAADLIAEGYEEFDPNAKLKADGFVWDAERGVYAKPKASN